MADNRQHRCLLECHTSTCFRWPAADLQFPATYKQYHCVKSVISFSVSCSNASSLPLGPIKLSPTGQPSTFTTGKLTCKNTNTGAQQLPLRIRLCAGVQRHSQVLKLLVQYEHAGPDLIMTF